MVSGGIHFVKAGKYCLTQSYTKTKDKNLYPSLVKITSFTINVVPSARCESSVLNSV